MTIPFFHDLEQKNLKAIRQFFTRRAVKKDEFVIEEGQESKFAFLVIVNGLVRVTAKDAEGKSITLQELKNGDWFGEVALIKDGIQPVSVQALEESTLLAVTAAEFANAVQKFPELGASVQLVGRNPPLKVQLKKIPFFADVGELKLQQLGTLCAVRRVNPGTKICAQGDLADGLFYIINGLASLRPSSSDSLLHQVVLKCQQAVVARAQKVHPRPRSKARSILPHSLKATILERFFFFFL